MPLPWADVERKEEYRKLPIGEQIKVRLQYFDDVVLPQVPDEDIIFAKKEFLEDTKFKPEANSVTGDIARTVRDTALAVPKVAGTVLSSIPAMAGGAISAGVTAIPEWIGLLPKGTSKETFDAVSNFLTYKPFKEMMKQGGVTEEGDRAWESGISAVSTPFEYLNNLAEERGQKELELALQRGDSPETASALATSINMAIKSIPFMLAKDTRKPYVAPETELIPKEYIEPNIKSRKLKPLEEPKPFEGQPIEETPIKTPDRAITKVGAGQNIIEEGGKFRAEATGEIIGEADTFDGAVDILNKHKEGGGLEAKGGISTTETTTRKIDRLDREIVKYHEKNQIPPEDLLLERETTRKQLLVEGFHGEGISTKRVGFEKVPKPTDIDKVEKIKVEKNILKITPSQRRSFENGYRQIEDATAGRRIVSPLEGSGTYEGTNIPYEMVAGVEPSTFPNWNQGMSKSESLPLIKKVLEGKPLTPAQRFRAENILNRIRQDEAEQLRYLRNKQGEKNINETSLGDEFKRNGEKYKVTNIDPDTGITEIKNKDTFNLKDNDVIMYDRGSYKKARQEGDFNLTSEEPATIKPQADKISESSDMSPSYLMKNNVIPISYEEAKILQNLNVDMGSKGASKATIRLNTKGAEQTGLEGWVLHDMPLKEKLYYGKKPLKEGQEYIKAVKLFNKIRDEKDNRIFKQEKDLSDTRLQTNYPIKTEDSKFIITEDKQGKMDESGSISLDLLVPEISKEDLKYVKPIARPNVKSDDDRLKEFTEGIKSLGQKYILNGWQKHLEMVKLSKEGKLSPEEEKELYGEIMFMAGGLPSTIKSGILPKFNPMQGLYQKLFKRLPERMQEFLSPMSTLKNAPDLLEQRAKLGGTKTQVDRIARRLEGWFKDFSDTDKEKIFDYMRGEIPATELTTEALKKAQQVRPVLNIAGKMAVKEGLLDPDIYAKNKDTYIHYLYAKHILGEDIPIRVTPSGKLNIGEFKGRMDAVIKKTKKEIIDKTTKKIVEDAEYQVVSKRGKAYSKPNLSLDEAKKILAQKQIEIEKYRKEIGFIKDPSIAIPTGIAKTLTDVETNKYFRMIADNPDWTWQPSRVKINGKHYSPLELADEVKTAKAVSDYAKTPETLNRYNILKNGLDEITQRTGNIPEGFKQLPDTPKLGALRGMVVKKPIADDIMPVVGLGIEDIGTTARTLVNLEKKSVALFKTFKVALNPPTAVRNTTSNVMQLNMSGMNLADIAYDLKNALTDMVKRNPEYVRAERAGIFKTNWAVSEINELLEGMKDVKGHQIFEKIENLAKYYGKIDDVFKFAKYKNGIRNGVEHKQAVLDALKWGMDYSLASRSVKYLRQHYIPFLSYQYKIAPLIAESLIERPWVIGKYAVIPYLAMEYTKKINDLSDADQKRLEKQLPYYIKNTGSYMVIPAKNEDGKYDWVNLKYFYPWGDFEEKAKMINQGEFGTLSQDLSAPTLQIIAAMKNWGLGKTPKDPFSGREIYSRFDKPQDKIAKTLAWIYNLHAPTAVSLENPISKKDFFSDYSPAGYTQRAITEEKDRYGRKITKTQAIGKWVGFNIVQPNTQQTYKIKQYQLKELEAGRMYALKKPNLSAEDRKQINKEYLEQRKNILSGETKTFTGQIKKAIKEVN